MGLKLTFLALESYEKAALTICWFDLVEKFNPATMQGRLNNSKLFIILFLKRVNKNDFLLNKFLEKRGIFIPRFVTLIVVLPFSVDCRLELVT
jgi:hypothetical protein